MQFLYKRNVFHYWHLSVAPGLFTWMIYTKCFFVCVCTFNILYIKKSLIGVSFQSDQQNGSWQSGRKMKCCQGTDCLCAISFENTSTSSSFLPYHEWKPQILEGISPPLSPMRMALSLPEAYYATENYRKVEGAGDTYRQRLLLWWYEADCIV